MSDFNLNLSISAELEDLDWEFIETHSDNWKDPENPTKSEFVSSLKSEIKAWLEALSFEVSFGDED